MARISGSNGARTAAAIRSSARGLIYRHGYAAMNLRELATEVGISPGSLYNHITTKQGLLFDLIAEHMAALLAETDAALAAAGPDPMARLRAFIAHHLLYHFERRQEVFIANFELRSLEPPNHARVVAMRRSYEGRLIALLDAGVATGELDIPDTHVAAYAILAMLTGVCTWYRPDGRLSKEELVALHTRLVLDGVRRHRGEAAARAAPPARPAAKAQGKRARAKTPLSPRRRGG
ncbi:TetR/AcrR family transcriptional regulator [Crenalkalicoccus roseus]|uniref:TetR/AcrR family transcriptional regulator n=1 Tax=Crenalkalicoccus roseus TaxID=1485588 RepID=UPI0010822C2E|nr:TetR/AcrR family transcriptional regulator [Crenalkalicoccus roseus]